MSLYSSGEQPRPSKRNDDWKLADSQSMSKHTALAVRHSCSTRGAGCVLSPFPSGRRGAALITCCKQVGRQVRDWQQVGLIDCKL